METQLFTWTNWEKHDEGILSFYQVQTVVDLPGIPVG